MMQVVSISIANSSARRKEEKAEASAYVKIVGSPAHFVERLEKGLLLPPKL
jgi:hypothetical protein